MLNNNPLALLGTPEVEVTPRWTIPFPSKELHIPATA